MNRHHHIYDHRTSCSTNLSQKNTFFFGIFLFFFITKFQNHGSKHDHGHLWIKNAPMYGVNTNEKIEQFVNMYISYDVSLLPNPLQNAQHQHTCTCSKKTMLFVDFIIHSFLCMEQ
jgi:hypothetical protein